MKLLKGLPLLSIICSILAASCLTIGNYPLLPVFFLIPVYYWLVYRPDLLPVWILLFIGLFYDALLYNSLGITSLLLVVSSILSQRLRRFLSSPRFLFIWGGFIVYSLGYLLLYGLLTFGGYPLVVSWLYGIIFYPLVFTGLSILHTRMNAYV